MSTTKVKWQNTMPTKEGKYWFYGELNMGELGRHYNDDYIPEPEMSLVTVHSNEMASANGQIIYRRTFDKEAGRPGWLGYWAAAELPEPPYDGNKLFNKPTEE